MKTIVGLFDNFSEAEAVVRDLERAGFDRSRVSVIANESARGGATGSAATADEEGINPAEGAAAGAVIGGVTGGVAGLIAGLASLAIPGVGPVVAAGPLVAALTGMGIGAVTGGLIGALVAAGVPEEHARAYEEGIRRGGTLVVVAANDSEAKKVMDVMNRHSPADIDQRAAQWQTGGSSAAAGGTRGVTSAATSGATTTTGSFSRDPDRSRAYARDENAGEEEPAAVVVVEEVVVAAEPAGVGAGVSGGSDFERYESDFRNNFRQSFPGREYTYDQVKPAYRYGYSLANENRGADWPAVESGARRRWEQRNPGTWERFKNAARYAWDRARDKVS